MRDDYCLYDARKRLHCFQSKIVSRDCLLLQSILADSTKAERALVSLPSPLTATAHVTVSRSRNEHITITAGLHRQVWVSGTNLFADVHIVNNSHKTVRKVELRLERIVLCYNHVSNPLVSHLPILLTGI